MTSENALCRYRSMYEAYWREPEHWRVSRMEHIAQDIRSVTGPSRVLDVGCGLGSLVLSLLGSGFDAIGVDVASRPVEHANKFAPGRFKSASALSLPFEDNSFPTVVSTYVLEHLCEHDVPNVLREIWRVCSGTFYLRISTLQEPDDKRRLTVKPRGWWEQQLMICGFRKHSAYMDLVRYEDLERDTPEITIVVEKIPESTIRRYPLTALKEERGLHMDMTREAGRRSDAHIVSYWLAQKYIRRGDTVLDLACGLGYGAAILAFGSGAARIIGVDSSSYAIDYAQANFGVSDHRIEFRLGDADAMQWLEDESVDYVVSMETLEHLVDPESFLSETWRILKPSGRIIASIPNMWVDDSGQDPSPYHLHVYDLRKLTKQIGTHFIIDRVWRQTAGGGVKLPSAKRHIEEAGREASGEVEAEWWLCMAMKSPFETTAKSRYVETVNPTCTDVVSIVADFASWYDRPYLYYAMVNRGMRIRAQSALVEIVREVIRTSDPTSADYGGALCVMAYQLLADLHHPTSKLDRMREVHDLLDRITDYMHVQSGNPHVARWQISLSYVSGKIYQQRGLLEEARAAFKYCMGLNPLEFSPLIATKTLMAGLTLAELEFSRDERDAAYRALEDTLAVTIAVIGHDWQNVIGSTKAPFVFGFVEIRDICGLAAKCVYLMHGLSRGWTKAFTYRNSKGSDLIRDMEEREEAIAGQSRILEERWLAMEEKEGAIREREEAIAGQSRILEERWSAMEEKEGAIRERDETGIVGRLVSVVRRSRSKAGR